MKFNIGQKVRVVKVVNPAAQKFLGAVTTITGYGDSELTEYRLDLLYEPTGKYWHAPGNFLEPVDDDADYKRFMERVMEPRPELQGLPLEVTA